ncbi:MAG: hypothetical protein QNK05_17105 [Myxococcota bacterium]|nr:hypothetical protein [Myxococcota bacterium]
MRAPPELTQGLFDEAPESEALEARAAGLLEAAFEAAPERAAALCAERPDRVRGVLWAIAAVGPFLTRFLGRAPEHLLELAEQDLTQPRSFPDLEARAQQALGAASSEAVHDALRRVKYEELARVIVRDALPELVPLDAVGETLGELSMLAEVLLTAALEQSRREFEAEVGPLVWRNAAGEAVPLGFVVLGLGKLGGGELNFSSDVDLVYVHEAPPNSMTPEGSRLSGGPGDLSPPEAFARLARRFGRAVEETTGEGFLYRIDLDLRPEGGQGALVVSDTQLVDYYDGWAAPWEKSAVMKARPVAGDLALGWKTARAIDPMIYSSSVDFRVLDSLREMKARVEAARKRAEDDVKLGPGGIRDVEFVAQALQMLHGGRAPQVRGRSAPGALRALAEIGAIDADEASELLDAYHYLRRVENRLQMLAERQTHRLPPPGERAALAYSMGGPASPAAALGGPAASAAANSEAAFEAELAGHRERVRARFDALFPSDTDARIAELFARHAGSLIASEGFRAQLDAIVERFASAVEASADPERALGNLGRFAESVASKPYYLGLLMDRPELAERLVQTFAASRFLSSILAGHPELIAPVFSDPERLLLPKADLEASFDAILAECIAEERDEEEAALAALRRFQMREVVNVGLLDLGERIDSAEAEASLTDIAEVSLDRGLALANQILMRQRPDETGPLRDGCFLIVGMGKLGSHELSYGSDLDVIFLFDPPAGEDQGPKLAMAQSVFVRLAQKLSWALQTRTAEGVCYEVDARLRPSGNQGLLVTSLSSFKAYHQEKAAAWERQALLRARPVAGSEELAGRFEAIRSELLQKAPEPDLGAEMHRVRARMEEELAKEIHGRRDLKTGRGGLLDVEMVVQLLQLTHGSEHPELLEPLPIQAMVERCAALGLLPAEDATTLGEGWRFLRRLSSRLRVVENRSISDISFDRSDLDSVARAMGYPAKVHSGSSRVPLLEDYRRHTEAIRAVYARHF